MNAFVPYLAALHQQDLLQQAMLERRAKLARHSQSSVPAWRRRLGELFASAAQSLDPSVEVERRARSMTGQSVDPLPGVRDHAFPPAGDRRATAFGFSLWEIEVYGPSEKE